MTASTEEVSEMITEFQKRRRNSCRTVLSSKMVWGDRPSDFQPSHFGVKSTQGIRLPFITSGAILKLVVRVQ